MNPYFDIGRFPALKTCLTTFHHFFRVFVWWKTRTFIDLLLRSHARPYLAIQFPSYLCMELYEPYILHEWENYLFGKCWKTIKAVEKRLNTFLTINHLVTKNGRNVGYPKLRSMNSGMIFSSTVMNWNG